MHKIRLPYLLFYYGLWNFCVVVLFFLLKDSLFCIMFPPKRNSISVILSSQGWEASIYYSLEYTHKNWHLEQSKTCTNNLDHIFLVNAFQRITNWNPKLVRQKYTNIIHNKNKNVIEFAIEKFVMKTKKDNKMSLKQNRIEH